MRKIEPLGKGSLARKILRALGKVSGFELSIPSQEDRHPGVSTYNPHYDFHKVLKNAMLETEQSKAKAIMAYQKHNLPR